MSFATWKEAARNLKRETFAVYLAARHPGTPLLAKVLGGIVCAYALSPIDLIPDFIPVLGYLDDLLLVPLGLWFTIRLIPPPILEECRHEADRRLERPVSYVGLAAVLLTWAALLALFLVWLS